MIMNGTVVTLEDLKSEDMKRAETRRVAKSVRKNRKGF